MMNRQSHGGRLKGLKVPISIKQRISIAYSKANRAVNARPLSSTVVTFKWWIDRVVIQCAVNLVDSQAPNFKQLKGGFRHLTNWMSIKNRHIQASSKYSKQQLKTKDLCDD